MTTRRISWAVVQVVLVLAAGVVLIVATSPREPGITEILTRSAFYPCPTISTGRCQP